MRFIWFVFVVAFIGWMIERAVRRGVLAATKVNDADIERSIRRGQGQDDEIETGAVVLGIVLWLMVFGVCGWILWQWLSH
jgi:hypothetical protein